MNRKQLFLLLAAGIVVGGLGLLIVKQRSASWQASSQTGTQKLLGEFPLNEVAQVVVKQAQNELNLIKGDPVWQVRERSNYPANYGEIQDLVRKLAELKPVQSVQVGPSQLGRLELIAPGKGTNSATLLELKDKSGKTLKSLLLGKKHMRESDEDSPMGRGGWPDGRYVMLAEGTPPVVWLVADPLSNVEPKPESWLEKEFFKVEKLKTISVTPIHAAQAWKFTRETESGDLKLADKQAGEEPDANKIVSLVNVLSYASFNDVLAPGTKPEETGLDKPVEVKIETFENFIYDIKIGKAGANDTYHLTLAVAANLPQDRTPGKDEKPEDKAKLDKEFNERVEKQKAKLTQEKACEKWVYLVSKWTVDNLLKDRSQWMVEKKEEKQEGASQPGEAATGFGQTQTGEPERSATMPPLPPGMIDAKKKDANK
jgi:hypothetical protein